MCTFRLHCRILLDPLLAAYLTSTFILAITPGATTAVVVRNTLARGTRGGFAAAAGAATGNTTQALVAILGAAVLFARWPAAALVIRVAGGLFLLWLGSKSLRRALAPGRHADPVRTPAPEPDRVPAFRQGLLVNLLNPAITSFYLAVVPSFVPAGAPGWYYAALSAAHVAIAFTCHSCWAVAFGRLRHHAEHPWLIRSMEGATGIVLVALAIQVMASA
jgi:threonine/homoserine/homoserine lactone efflux protein